MNTYLSPSAFPLGPPDSPPTALVTGANRGLGRSIALALAASGHRVVVTHRPGGDADETVRQIAAAGGQAVALALDVSDVASFDAFVGTLATSIDARWGSSGLDVLINNAGVGLFDPLSDVTPERFDEIVRTNFRGTFFLIRTLVPIMGAGAHILNVSSSLTRHVSPATSVYAASKAAVETLTRALASELGPLGIRINSIAPGPTATDFNGGAMRDDAELREVLAERTALGRVGHPEEIGDAIAALVSSAMRWVTGERVEVSGGAFL